MSDDELIDALRFDLLETAEQLGLLLRASFPGDRLDLMEAFLSSMREFAIIKEEKQQETVKRVFTVACTIFKLPLVLAVFGSEFEAEFPKHDSLDCVRMVVGCKETGVGFAAVWRA